MGWGCLGEDVAVAIVGSCYGVEGDKVIVFVIGFCMGNGFVGGGDGGLAAKVVVGIGEGDTAWFGFCDAFVIFVVGVGRYVCCVIVGVCLGDEVAALVVGIIDGVGFLCGGGFVEKCSFCIVGVGCCS